MLNLREVPFLRLLALFSAGILLAMYFNYNSISLMVLLALLPPLAWAANKRRKLYRYRWLYGALMSAILLLLGYQVAWFHLETNKKDHFLHFPFPEERMVIGKISDAPVKKGEWVKIVLVASAMGPLSDSLRPVSGNVLVYLERDTSAVSLQYGDEVCFKGSITKVAPPKNPNAFDYSRYLHFQNIHHQAFVREGDWLLHKKRKSFSLYGAAIQMQERFVATLRKHLPTNDEYTVGSALILGYRNEVPEDLLTAYSETGAMHVLAVSGLHVGVVFIILNFFFARVKWYSPAWAIAKVLLILGGIWTFALVTGATPSVLRAAVMFSFLNVGMAMKRNNNVYNNLSCSAFFLLLWNPYWVVSVSFQLSYLAVFGIVYFQPKIAKLWAPKNKWMDKIWQMTAVSVAAQLMTLPLTLYYFNQFPTWFWLTSLILVPLSGIELGTGLLLFLVEAVWEWGAIWVGKALWAMLWLGNWTVYAIQQLPLSVIDGIWLGAGAALLLYLIIIGSMLAIGSGKFKWVLYSLGLLLLVSVNSAFTAWNWTLNRQIVVYNVYKHSAIDFLEGKKGWSLVSQDIDQKAMKFAVEGHRTAMGIKEAETFEIGKNAHVSERWFYENGLVQFYNKKMAIVERPVNTAGNEKVKVDYLLLRNSPKVEIADLLRVFDCSLILFDASNKKWRVGQWKQACEELGLAYYDINEMGAWVMDMDAVN